VMGNLRLVDPAAATVLKLCLSLTTDESRTTRTSVRGRKMVWKTGGFSHLQSSKL